MDGEHGQIISIKTYLGNEVKRFELPSNCASYVGLIKTIKDLYKGYLKIIVKYKDEEEELITMSTEEEFQEALKTMKKTGDTLKIYLNETENVTEKKRKNSNKDLQLIRQDSKSKSKQSKIEIDDNARKSSVPHKIESASQLSKDIELVSSEVTGRIPVASPALKCGLDTHFISQKPGCRKIRHLSSSSCEKRSETRKRRFKNRKSSVHSSESSSSSSASSWSSSSSESCSDDEDALGKRPSTPTTSLNKLLTKFEERIHDKMIEDLQSCMNEMKKEITSSVTHAVLQQLDGAVIESIKTTNSSQAAANNISGFLSSPLPKDDIGTKTSRVRYHHKNVICDNCENEIFGPRYKCGNCSDYDLCEKCEDIEGIHTPSHVFLKLHYPSVHAGRKTLGGKPSPLLNANIYEERETEREREELLQRKFDSGSELNSKTLEKIEKQRMKMREAKLKKEAHELRKEEWKKVRKELRKNKRDITRKLKLAKMQHHPAPSSMELGGVQELTLPPAECQGCYVNRLTDSSSLQDQNVMTALSGLQIVQTSQENIEPVLKTLGVSNTSLFETPSDSLVQSLGPSYCGEEEANNVSQFDMIQTAIGAFEDIPQQEYELVDMKQDEVSSVTSEDFIVVSKVFDLDTPLDRDEIRKRLKCEKEDEDEEEEEEEKVDSDDESEQCTDDEIQKHEKEEEEEEEEEKEEVASDDESEQCSDDENKDDEYYDSSTSFMTEQTDSDIISSIPTDNRNETVESPTQQYNNIMDYDIDSSGELSPPELTPTPSIEIYEPIYPVIETQPSVSPRSPEEPLALIVDKQPVPQNAEELAHTQVISTQPSLHDEIMTLKETVENKFAEPNTEENQPKTLLEQATAAQQRVEQSKGAEELVLEMQREGEKAWLEQYGKQECNVDLLKNVAEAAGSNEAQPLDVEKENKNTTSFGEALSDTLASVVDAAATVAASLIQPSSPLPKASYSKEDGDVNVITAENQKQSCMGQLFDMGFFDRDLNAKLLRKHNNDVTQCVNELVQLGDNHWHQGRH